MPNYYLVLFCFLKINNCCIYFHNASIVSLKEKAVNFLAIGYVDFNY